jgi:hypothetical protein
VSKPTKGSFHDPTAREQHKAFAAVGTFDNFDDPIPDGCDPFQKPFDVVTGVRPDEAQTRVAILHTLKHQFRPILFLGAGSVNNNHQHQAQHID